MSSRTRTKAPAVADQVAARLIWFDEEPMLPGRAYTLKCGCQTTTATISSLKYKLNVDNLDHVAGKTLELNEVGFVQSRARPRRSRSIPTRRTARPAASS